MTEANNAQRGVTRSAARAFSIGAALVAAAVLSSQLTACVPIVVGAVGAGVYGVTDRRSIGAQTDDKVISVRVDKRISEAMSDRAHVNVNSFNRKVLLTGEVPDQAAKDRAIAIAKSVDNVASVVSDLEIGGMTPSTSRNNDAYITGKVKTDLLANKIPPNTVSVVTEKRVVYLMGRVTEAEGDRAAEAARGVSDVAQVVKVFDYLTPEELTALQKSGSP
jgi:osmotically-inducible protein OsmY